MERLVFIRKMLLMAITGDFLKARTAIQATYTSNRVSTFDVKQAYWHPHVL
jgi:hypothetical protein